MQAVDLQGALGKYFFDENRKIPPAHLRSICKYKQSENTCRYIALSPNGFSCMKKTPIKPTLDQKVKDGLMRAQGDNCEGLGDIDKKSE